MDKVAILALEQQGPREDLSILYLIPSPDLGQLLPMEVASKQFPVGMFSTVNNNLLALIYQ